MKISVFFKLFLVLATTIFMFSCSKDDDNDTIKESIVGKWQLTSNDYFRYEDGKLVEEEHIDFTKKANKSTIEFKADGTGVNIDYDGSEEPTVYEDEFTYVLKGNKISISIDDLVTEFTYIVEKDKITFESEEKNGSSVEKNVNKGIRVK